MGGRLWQAGVWAASALAALSVLLVAANGYLSARNQGLQADINQRQQFINQSVQLGQLDSALIRALASAAVAKHDDRLRDILAEVGVTMTVNPEPPAEVGKKP